MLSTKDTVTWAQLERQTFPGKCKLNGSRDAAELIWRGEEEAADQPENLGSVKALSEKPPAWSGELMVEGTGPCGEFWI